MKNFIWRNIRSKST